MTYKLFIDDERFPVTDDWVIVRTSEEASKYVAQHGMPTEISFDHDLGKDVLGDDDTSMHFIWWIINTHYDHGLEIPADFTYYVHSQNPIGARNIKGLMDGFLNDIRS